MPLRPDEIQEVLDIVKTEIAGALKKFKTETKPVVRVTEQKSDEKKPEKKSDEKKPSKL